jgi:hypothetical protein
MFGLFGNKPVKLIAEAIHQLCHASRHAHQTLGPKASIGLFLKHPMLVADTKPSNPYDGHEFRLGAELSDFRFLVYEDRGTVQVFGGGDFSGFSLTTTPSGGYQVYTSQSLSGSIGRYTETLAKEFIHRHGAHDTSDLMR